MQFYTMVTNRLYLFVFVFFVGTVYGQQIKPIFPVPSAKQLAWQDLEYYGFIHFNMNTFTNVEWGEGKEEPKLFNPTQWIVINGLVLHERQG
jgi:alpha-L-fucosidase